MGKLRIILAHNHYNQAKLDDVISEMRSMGVPRVKAVWMECWDTWVALEGCHRIRAAHMMGIPPEIGSLDYDDVCDLDLQDADLGLDFQDSGKMGEFIDEGLRRIVLTWEE